MEKRHDGLRRKKREGNELISVIVPIYRVEAYLPCCLESICGQTYAYLEIILVDDGSPDACGQICDDYAKKDKRISVIHKRNGGLSDARNTGLAAAHGEWVCFIDSDDYLAENMLELLYRRCMKDHSDMAVCNLVYVDEAGTLMQENNKDVVVVDEVLSAWQALDKLYEYKYWYFVMAQNKLYRRELFSHIRFPRGKLHEDEFVMYRIFEICRHISCVSGGLYYYRKRSDSIMGKPYSVQRLDGVEAYLEQAVHFVKMGRKEHAVYAMNSAEFLLKEGRSKLDLRFPEHRNRCRELKRQLWVTSYRVGREFSFPACIVYWLFRRHKKVLLACKLFEAS